MQHDHSAHDFMREAAIIENSTGSTSLEPPPPTPHTPHRDHSSTITFQYIIMPVGKRHGPMHICPMKGVHIHDITLLLAKMPSIQEIDGLVERGLQ
jgi:hypothetical protein